MNRPTVRLILVLVLLLTLAAASCGDRQPPAPPAPPELFVSTELIPDGDVLEDLVQITAVESLYPVTRRFFVRNDGGGELNYTITISLQNPVLWLLVDPTSGTLQAGEQEFIYLTLAADTSGITPGAPAASANLEVAAGEDSRTIWVQLSLQAQPTISVTSTEPSPPWSPSDPPLLQFTASDLDAVLDLDNTSPSSVLEWAAVANQPWIQVSPSQGIIQGTISGAESTPLTVYAVPSQVESWGFATDAVDVVGRYGHVAVWTGRRMLIWGGWDGSAVLNTGKFFDPSAGVSGAWSVADRSTFSPTGYDPDISGAPNGRTYASAVWTGSEVIIWGGWNGITNENTGHVYDPAADAWTGTITTTGAPSARYAHSAVWTGGRMIIWGGIDGNGRPLADGAIFDMSILDGTWISEVAPAGAPSPRFGHSVVWTGSRMIIWGGSDGTQVLNDGASYSLESDTWDAGTPLSLSAPQARIYHTAVWTGIEMIVWGGRAGAGTFLPAADGGRFNPAGNTWEIFNPVGTPPLPRWKHTAVWTGRHMIVWGGETADPLNAAGTVILNTGRRYQPPIDLSGVNISGTLRIEDPRAGNNSTIAVELTLP